MQAHAVEERRAHRRVEIAANAAHLVRGAEVNRYLMQSLSAAGALLTGSSPLALGEKLDLRLDLPQARSLVVRAQVVRQADTVGEMVAIAVAFLELTPDSGRRHPASSAGRPGASRSQRTVLPKST